MNIQISELKMKCGFCKFFQPINQKCGNCVLNPPFLRPTEKGVTSEDFYDIVVLADRKGCQYFKFEQGFLYPNDKKEK